MNTSRHSHPFYHPGITSLQAEEKLRAAKHDGSFLIRDGSSPANSYCLCLLWSNTVYKYRILSTADGRLYLQSSQPDKVKTYADLASLVQSVADQGEGSGMQCGLSCGVKSEEFADDSDDSDYSDDNDFLLAHGKIVDPAAAAATQGTFGIGTDDRDGANQPAEQARQEATYGNERQGVAVLARQLRSKVTQYAEKCSKDAVSCSVDPNQFVNAFDKYLSTRFEDDLRAMRSDSCSTGTSPMFHLNNFIADEGKEALKCLSALCWKLNVLCQAFDGGPHEVASDCSSSYQSLMKVVCDCRDMLLDTKKHAIKLMESAVTAAVLPAAEEMRPEDFSNVAFEVRIRTGLKGFVNYTVDMDVNAGKIGYFKCSSTSVEKFYIQIQNVLQVIKDADNSSKLTVIVSDRKKEQYAFSDVRSREHFCQLIQQMKRMHTPTSDIEQISVFVGTWNIGFAEPPLASQGLPSWLHSSGLGKTQSNALVHVPHDLYAIGIQESALSEKEWLQRIRKALQLMFNIEFHTVAVCTLWAIKLIILVRPEHKNRIHHVTQDTVKTGIANALGNKGAAAVSFCFEGTSLCFVNAHLTANTERCERRNQNYRDILRGLSCSVGGRVLSDLDITHQFHHVFWFGDLNYRVDENVMEAVRKAESGEYQKLFSSDQLTKVKAENKAFYGFDEEDITFPPTYRYRKGTVHEIHYRKEKKTGVKFNTPSWCDRVLWKSFPGLHLQNTSYGIVKDVRVSDHKPLFSTFTIGIAASGSTSHSDAIESVSFQVQQIEAEIQTSQKEPSVQLLICSSCLESSVYCDSTKLDRSTSHDGCTITKVAFTGTDELRPVINDPTYIEEQYLLMAVKSGGDSSGGGEVFGACAVPLSDLFENSQLSFQYDLTHAGERSGLIRGVLKGKVVLKGGGGLRRGESYRRNRKSILIVSSREMPHEKWDEAVVPEEQQLSLSSLDANARPPPAGRSLLPSVAESCGGVAASDAPAHTGSTSQQGVFGSNPWPMAPSPYSARRTAASLATPESPVLQQQQSLQCPPLLPRGAARPAAAPLEKQESSGSRAPSSAIGVDADAHEPRTTVRPGGRLPVALPSDAATFGSAASAEQREHPTAIKSGGRPPVALPPEASFDGAAATSAEAQARVTAVKPGGRLPVVPRQQQQQQTPAQSGPADQVAHVATGALASRWPPQGK